MSYDDVYRESLHDWLDNRPGPDRPSLAEAEADERRIVNATAAEAEVKRLDEIRVEAEAKIERLRGQKEDLMVALREEGFELAAAMRMIARRDRKLQEWRKAYETFEREGTMLALLRAYEGTHDG